MPDRFAGRLLVASPALRDPNFVRTVVYVLDEGEHGALGVVLNRPTTVSLLDVLPAWFPVATGPEVLFSGGPVSRSTALGLTVRPAAADAPGPGVRFAGPVSAVDLDGDPTVAMSGAAGLRVFAGYAGWGAGQLDAEVTAGGWYVVPAQPTDLLTAEPDGLWRRVLRRQPPPLALVATFPRDPALN